MDKSEWREKRLRPLCSRGCKTYAGNLLVHRPHGLCPCRTGMEWRWSARIHGLAYRPERLKQAQRNEVAEAGGGMAINLLCNRTKAPHVSLAVLSGHLADNSAMSC